MYSIFQWHYKGKGIVNLSRFSKAKKCCEERSYIHDKHWPDLHIHFEALLNTLFPIHVFALLFYIGYAFTISYVLESRSCRS